MLKAGQIQGFLNIGIENIVDHDIINDDTKSIHKISCRS